MKQFLVINMATGAILADYETLLIAEETADKVHPHPNHILDTAAAEWDISGPDIVRIHNALPGVEKVTRFSSKVVAQKRLLGALNSGGVAPPASPSPTPLTTEEIPVPKKQKPKKLPGKRAATAGVDRKLIARPLPEGARKQVESVRSKVYAAIASAGQGIMLSTLISRCAPFATAGQVRGCVQKLLEVERVKVVS